MLPVEFHTAYRRRARAVVGVLQASSPSVIPLSALPYSDVARSGSHENMRYQVSSSPCHRVLRCMLCRTSLRPPLQSFDTLIATHLHCAPGRDHGSESAVHLVTVQSALLDLWESEVCDRDQPTLTTCAADRSTLVLDASQARQLQMQLTCKLDLVQDKPSTIGTTATPI